MIDTYDITVYAVKSTRKNAKFIWKSFRVWDMEGAKKKFTDDNIADLKQWVKLSPYNLYNLVVYHNSVALVTWAEHHKSDYQIETQVIEFMNLINNGGF